MAIVEFLGLLLILTYAAYLLSQGAEVLSEKWGFNVVGSIMLALVTTLPEYAFVFWASMKEQYRMAIGSAIGSCTLLITLGYGLVILLATSRFSRKPVPEIKLSPATRVDAAYLLVTALVALAFVWGDNALSFWEGLVLAAVFLGYALQVVRSGIVHHAEKGHRVPRRDCILAFVKLIAGGVIVYVCSEPFVDSMIHVATLLGVSPVAIAIVLGPIASEMPEKLTAYIVVLRDGSKAELSVCNFIGSKVNHNSLLLAVMPFVAHVKGHDIVRGLMSINFLVMTILTVVVSGLLATGRVKKWQGFVLVLAYVIAMVLAVGFNG